MKPYRTSLLAPSLLALVSWASAQVITKCPSTDVCYKLNIPQNTASSGSGDIFFQIKAPSSYEWVALGQGKGMTGANMFLVYTNSDGSNVTLSPRTTTGHVQPTFNSNAKVQLLDGSGVSNGVMTANVKCSSCTNWGSGTMDFTGSSGGWIYAYQDSGGPKNSNDQNAGIDEHSSKAAFTWAFTSAKGGNDLNPFTSSGSSSNPSTTSPNSPNSSTSPASPTSTGSDGYSQGDGDGDGDGDGGDSDSANMMLIAHGVMASLAFVILFPAGAIAVRLASFPGIVWIHAAFQIFAYLVFITAFGLGIHIANQTDLLNHYHPIIGIILFVLTFFQPFLGFMHHTFFQKHQRRTFWSHAHIWLGRIIITLGIINGGFGLDLAGDSSTGERVAYAIIGATMWLVYVAAIVIGERRKKSVPGDSLKYNDSPVSAQSHQNETEMPTLSGPNAREGGA